METIKLSKEAPWKDNGSKEILERLANESKSIIKENFNYGQRKFKEYINNQKSSISENNWSYSPDKSNIDFYF